MVYHISAKKIVKDLMITLNKYRINYRIDIKNINKKQPELYNKKQFELYNKKQLELYNKKQLELYNKNIIIFINDEKNNK
tara:strand:- start:196 stop:435 length:240 start_codon:yes stop_codon:yes gene_type:complete